METKLITSIRSGNILALDLFVNTLVDSTVESLNWGSHYIDIAEALKYNNLNRRKIATLVIELQEKLADFGIVPLENQCLELTITVLRNLLGRNTDANDFVMQLNILCSIFSLNAVQRQVILKALVPQVISFNLKETFCCIWKAFSCSPIY